MRTADSFERTLGRRARHDVAEGPVIRMEDIDFERPGAGPTPAEVDRVVDRLLRSLERDEPVRPEDVE